jgi:hypothetical protein
MYGRLYTSDHFFEWLFTSGGCVCPLVLLPVTLLFFSTLARVAMRVRRENRRIDPGQVWLNLVPVFNLVWLPITVDRLADSIRRECEERGLDQPGEGYTRPVGLTWLVLSVLAVPVTTLAPELGCAVLVFVPTAVMFWVVYWWQLAGYARRLKATKYLPPADEGW